MFFWLMQNKFKILVIFSVIVLIFLANFYLHSTKPTPKVEIKKENEIIVDFFTAKVDDYQPFLSAYGRVKTQRTGNLSFGVSGVVSYLSEKFVNGGKVKKGEVLGKLDDKKYTLNVERLKTDVKELKKQLELRKKQLDRRKKMLEKRVISPSFYDEELIKYSKNLQEFNNSKINLGIAKKDLNDTVLKAKSDGIISEVKIHEGLLVSSNSKLAIFKSLDHVEIEFMVPAKVLFNSKKMIGKKVQVLWETGNKYLVKKDAEIVRVQGNINDESGGGKIYAKFLVNSGDLIPLDSFVKVIYPVEKFVSVVKIPETALYNDKYVFVIQNDRAKKISVNVIHSNAGYYLLEKENLEGSDIIINRFSSDIEGTKIKYY